MFLPLASKSLWHLCHLVTINAIRLCLVPLGVPHALGQVNTGLEPLFRPFCHLVKLNYFKIIFTLYVILV